MESEKKMNSTLALARGSIAPSQRDLSQIFLKKSNQQLKKNDYKPRTARSTRTREGIRSDSEQNHPSKLLCEWLKTFAMVATKVLCPDEVLLGEAYIYIYNK
jgi:hypothetical protein